MAQAPEINQMLTAFYQVYDDLGIELTELLKQELSEQGHRASGNLIKSVVHTVSQTLDNIETVIYHDKYGVYVNFGVMPSRVPFTISRNRAPRAPGTESKFIRALMNWIRLKNIAQGLDKDIKQVAFRMAFTMKREGIPTKGSFRFARNSRRTRWIDYVFQQYGVKLEDKATMQSQQIVADAVDSVLNRIANKYSSITIS